MTQTPPLSPDPSAIGGIAQAPYAILPRPARLFARRAARFQALAEGHPLGPYLRFLAGVTAAQARLADTLPPLAPLDEARREAARAGGMPPIDRAALARDGSARDTLHALFDALLPLPKPAAAEGALAAVRAAGPARLAAMAADVAADAIPADALATHLYVAAGLHLHAARLAATLEAGALGPVGQGLCPACGGPPVASLVVGFEGAEGTRYAACAFCATLWNEVRITCLACGSTKGIGYRAVDAGGGTAEATVKAEVCDSCRCWIKILYQNRNASLDPVADDVGSLGLDVMMAETAYRPAGFDPFTVGTAS